MMAALRGILALSFLGVFSYGVWEIRRWETPLGRETVSIRQRTIRSLGLIFLLLTLGLWLRGTFLPTPHSRLALVHYLGYWIITACAVLPLIPLALLDARANLLRALADRQRLRQDALASPGAPSLQDPE